MTWTSFGARTTTCTLLLINLRNTRLRIDRDGTKLASSHAITTTQTAESAAGFTSATGVHSSTSMQTIILGDARTMLARAITTNHSHLCLCVSHSQTQEISYLAHHVGTTYRTHQPIDATCISTLDQRCSHTGTSGKTATTTVGTRKEFTHLSQSRVFFDGKLLRYSEEHQCCNQRNGTEYQDRNQNKIHNNLYLF